MWTSQPAGNRLSVLLDRLASVAMIVAAVAVVWVAVDRVLARPITIPNVEGLDAEPVLDRPPTAAARGDENAPIVLVEFSEFECPFCGTFAHDVYPQLAAEYIDTGRVRYVFRHFPSPNRPSASTAAEAAECAGREGLFWEMHDRLFAARGAFSMPDLLRYGRSIGLDLGAFEECLEGGDMAMRVAADREYAIELGATGTPTFLVAEVQPDGTLELLARIRGLRDYSTIASALDEALSVVAG